MIIQETYDFIRTSNNEILHDSTIEKVVIGVHFTATKLSSGFAGVSKTEITHRCCNSDRQKRNFGAFTPGNIQGRKIHDLFEYREDSDIINNVRLAVLNAVSAEIIARSGYSVMEGKDPIELVNLNQHKTICIVGAFHSYIRKISGTSNKLYVLELDENAFDEDQKRYFVPANRYAEILAKSDIIIITGSTIANNTIDSLLDYIPPQAVTILVGPSSSLVPDVLFKHKVDIIGSTRILDADKMFSIISEGGAGYHLFNYCAQKICILNDSGKTS
ncbi:MAG: DUF364 domain-containing protein [Bacteroidales bacterium]|nr:DUF364 domain-containing protein [Bacteroidales bacterium]MDD4603335.1 DUF364 domain-containing protein [Bacteroidales bacterium]